MEDLGKKLISLESMQAASLKKIDHLKSQLSTEPNNKKRSTGPSGFAKQKGTALVHRIKNKKKKDRKTTSVIRRESEQDDLNQAGDILEEPWTVTPPGPEIVDSYFSLDHDLSLGLPDEASTRRKRIMTKAISYLVVASALIIGAWMYFPIWFGVEGMEQSSEEEPNDSQQAVTAQSQDQNANDFDPATQNEEENQDTNAAEAENLYAIGQQLLTDKQYQKAATQLSTWVRQNPNDPTLRYLYARALYSSPGKKSKSKAINQMKRAIALDSKYADAYYLLGGMYSKLKKKKSARKALLAFVKLNPNDQRVPLVRRQLKKLRKHRIRRRRFSHKTKDSFDELLTP